MEARSQSGTYFPSGKDIVRRAYVIDATNLRVGRLANEAVRLLMGKDRPDFTPFLDMGAHVIVVNAARVILTGDKREKKVYFRYTGYPGGLRRDRYEDVMAKHPERVIELAIKGMLPKSRLGRRMAKRLRVYGEGQHPHQNLQPVTFKCQRMGLQDFEEFYKALTIEFLDWASALPESEREAPSVQMGREQYSPARIALELEQRSPFGEHFCRMMYRYHFKKPPQSAGGAHEDKLKAAR